MRHALKRDFVDLEIFRALEAAGCKPVRGRDVDLFAISRTDLQGVLLEVKDPKRRNNLRPIQKALKELFGSRYVVVTSVSEALEACGIKA